MMKLRETDYIMDVYLLAEKFVNSKSLTHSFDPVSFDRPKQILPVGFFGE